MKESIYESSLTNSGKLGPGHSYHAQITNFTSPAQIEKGQAHNTNFLV